MSDPYGYRPRVLRTALAQLNLTVGDITGNTARIIEAIDEARRQGADLVLFPELATCGYPPEDLLLRPSFLRAAEAALARIAPHTAGLTAVVGYPDRDEHLFNAAAVLHDGALAATYHKAYLPNYSVFDEQRYFAAGERAPVFRLGDGGEATRFGVSICEDIWYATGPPELQARAGAEVLVNISASPFHGRKGRARERMLATRAADNRAFVVFCNLVGGQDELVFDGNSLVIAPSGEVLARGPSFEEALIVVDLHPEEAFRERLLDPRHRSARLPRVTAEMTPEVGLPVGLPDTHPPLPAREDPTQLDGLAEVHGALVLGIRDYAAKNGFREAVIGLSGGIDSALTAVLAVDALGAEAVTGVLMPSRYTSQASIEDAEALAANLGFRTCELPIDDVFSAYLEQLSSVFEGLAPDTTEENIQARIRGNDLMALSNKFGYLVLSTGNKSETSVGYATLYGDMAGGFAPLKDVPKTLAYDLARWRNTQADGPWIPEHSITRAPSAELRADQTDQDMLPPYETLDPIVEAYVEDEKSVPEIVDMGFDRADVERVAAMVDRAEYKRRQGPPGIKITERAFGRDRRMPITKRVRLDDGGG